MPWNITDLKTFKVEAFKIHINWQILRKFKKNKMINCPGVTKTRLNIFG